MNLNYTHGVIGQCYGEYYVENVTLECMCCFKFPFRDTILIHLAQTIKYQEFGVATNSSRFSMGMMGVGFGEVGLVTGYFNIIDGLYEQG